MTHLLEGRLKGIVEEADKERYLKEVSKSNLREQATKLAATERRSTEVEKACVATEKRVADLEGKLDDAEVKLAQAKSIILDREKEIADLKVALAQSKDKFYNIGFVDTKNSSEPIMFKSRCYGFREGWMATVNALDLLEDSPFRDSKQIPLPKPPLPPPVQTSTPNEKEDSLNMRELMEEIDSHTEVIDLDNSTNLVAFKGQKPPASLPNPSPPMNADVTTTSPKQAQDLEA